MVMMLLFLTPGEQSRGLLSSMFLPSLAWSVSLISLSACTHCRTLRGVFLFLQHLFLNNRLLLHFLRAPKKVTMTRTGRKILLCFMLQRRWNR